MWQLAENYPVQVVCRVWEVPRSTSYYRSQAADESELRAAVQRLAGQWPRYGSRRLTAQVNREGFRVGRRHIQRVMRELGIQGQACTKKRRTRHLRASISSLSQPGRAARDRASGTGLGQ